MDHDLHRAFDNNEFVLHYQPQINLQSGKVIGFEALLRWQHPQRGILPAADFIAAAEESGLIVPLGAWVLKTACKDAAGWSDGLKVAVNLSAAQFRSNTLMLNVMAALTASGLAADRLELEVTESLLLHETGATLAALRELRQLGVLISLDDFGIGYSSLGHLQKFTFDKIKIHQSFIRAIARGNESEAIVGAIIDLGKGLKTTVAAEGVETQDQFEFLSAEGCVEAQGYLFSPPVALADVPGLLGASKAGLAV